MIGALPRTHWKTALRRLRHLYVPDRSAQVASRWARLASQAFVKDLERVSWTGIPQVHLNHNYLITGTRNTYWVEWLRDRYFPGGLVGDALSLGCGAGHLDRILTGC